MSSVSNGLYFLTLPLVSVMHVIYTSKGMSKKYGVRVIHQVRVIYRKIRYILCFESNRYSLLHCTAILIMCMFSTLLKCVCLICPCHGVHKLYYYYYYHHHHHYYHHHLLYAGYLYLYSWYKLCP